MKGITIKVRRIRLGLSQSQLAKMVGLTQPVISQLEQGFYIPGPELMQKINNALKQQKTEQKERK